MKAVIAIVVFITLFGLISAQTPTCPTDATFCEKCLGEATGAAAGCIWCQTPTFGACVAASSCAFFSGGVVYNTTDNCTTCQTTSDEANYCEFTHNTFETTKASYCDQFNDPQSGTTGTITTSTSTTAPACQVSQQCELAAYSLVCTYYCSYCNKGDLNSIGNTKYCQPQCDDYNNVSCKAEIANGCPGFKALDNTSCTSNTSICNPRINASNAIFGHSATSATTAATTATTAATTATTAATTATAAATTATAAATTSTHAATTATGAATTATGAATTALTTATKAATTGKSSASTFALSALLLLVCVFLF